MERWIRFINNPPFISAGIAFYGAAILSFYLLYQPGAVLPVWLVDAVAMAAMVRTPYRQWPLLALWMVSAQWLACLTIGGEAGIAFAAALLALPPIAFGAALVRRIEQPGRTLTGMAPLLKLLVIMQLVPAASASLASLVDYSHGVATAYDSWIHSYAGIHLGLLALLPAGITCTAERLRKYRIKPLYPLLFIGFAIITLGTTYMALTQAPYSFVYLELPLVIGVLCLDYVGGQLLIGLTVVAAALLSTLGVFETTVTAQENPVLVAYLPLAAAIVPPLVLGTLLSMRRREQQAIADSEELFRNAMEHAAIGMGLVTPLGRWVQVNDAMCNLLGYEREALLAVDVRNLVHPDDLNNDLLRGRDLAAGHINSYQREKRYIRRDGTVVWGLAVTSAMRNQKGEFRYFIVQIENIDRRKRAEEALLASEERWKFALEGSGQGVWDWSDSSGHFFLSGSWKRTFGYEPHELNGGLVEWANNIHPDDVPQVKALVKAHLKGQTPYYESEHRVRCKDGSYKWALSRGMVVERAPNGRALRMIGTQADITEVRRIALALHEEKERLQVTLASIADAVITTDEFAHITFMNPVAEIMTGWSLAECRGKAIEEVFRVIDASSEQPLESVVKNCLVARAVCHLGHEATLVDRSGARHDVQESAAPVKTTSGEVIGAVLVFQNVTEDRARQRKLTFSASHDALTGLANRVQFERELNQALSDVRDNGSSHMLCFIDLDRFKMVNDSAGHAAGDRLLCEISALIQHQIRNSDLVARLGGDEFGMLLRNCAISQAQDVLREMLERINAYRFLWNEQIYDIGASIGVTPINAQALSVSQLMSQADLACYAAKHGGRNQISIYQPDHSSARQQRKELLLAAGIRNAVEQDRFVLYAQSIIATSGDQDCQRYELLLRMVGPGGDIVAPDAFIPPAERFGLMLDIDRWVLKEVLERRAAPIAATPNLSLSINLSVSSLSDPLFLHYVTALLDRSPVRPSTLLFEIAESALLNHYASVERIARVLRERGCRIVLDDFGTGLNSFHYLKSFCADAVKIDSSFLQNLAGDSVDRAIVASVHNVAQQLHKDTYAKCVESEETLALVREIGISYAQGYAIARPEPLQAVLQHKKGEGRIIPFPGGEVR